MGPKPAPPTTNLYLKAKIEERTSQAQVLANLQNTAVEASRDLTPDERKTFDSITTRLTELDQEIERIVAAEKSAAKFVEVYGGHLSAQAQADADRQRRQREAANGGAPEERTGQFASWGQQFSAFLEKTEYHGHGSSQAFQITGPFLDGQRGSMIPLEERQTGPIHNDTTFDVTSSWEWGTGQNIMATQGGFETPSMAWAGPRQPAERYPVFSVIGRVPTSMGSVEYYYWFPDPEAMASEVPEGELKPEAQLSGEMRAAPVSTYAWWKGITRQALDDIPMIRGVVDTMLRRGVIRRINAEAATALTTDTNIPAMGDGAALLSVIRFAIAQVDEAGYSSNAVLLNPFDWAAFDVQIQQLLGTTGDINRVFWGLTPVSVPGLPSGTCYVGDMREGVTFFDRQSTTLLMTDSHGEYFLRNKLVLLAEARGKVAVTNAAALVKCTGEVPETPEGLSAQIQGAQAAAVGAPRRAVEERRREAPRRPPAPPAQG